MRTAQALANLALWDVEFNIVSRLKAMGFHQYTRLTDDITISADDPRAIERLEHAIRLIHQMLRSRGFRRKGKKERVSTRAGQMFVNNVLTNRKPSLPRKARDKIAREVIAFATRLKDTAGWLSTEDETFLRHVAGRINALARFHSNEAQRLGSLLHDSLPAPSRGTSGLRRWVA